MKPFLIFQFRKPMLPEHKKDLLKGIAEGRAVILDDSVTILSFDSEGNLNYCTPQKVEEAT